MLPGGPPLGGTLQGVVRLQAAVGMLQRARRRPAARLKLGGLGSGDSAAEAAVGGELLGQLLRGSKG